MSLPPTDQPFIDDEDDFKRKAEIEEMMRWQRENYFRNEPVQQEYRDIVTRLGGVEKARGKETATDLREPGPFDVALARFMDNKRETESANANLAINPRLQAASLAMPLGSNLPDDDVSDANDRLSSDAMLNRAAKATGFKQTVSGDGPSVPLQSYRVAQVGAFAKRPAVEEAKPPISAPLYRQLGQPAQKISNPAIKAIEWMLDLPKYAGEIEQFTEAKA